MAASLDLLIRSTSTLLSIVNPRVTPSTAYGDGGLAVPHAVQRLDRLSLLLVTSPNKEVAAIAAAVTGSEITLFEAHSVIDPVEEDTFHATKNSRAIPRNAWVEQCLEKGPLGHDLHVAQLEFLIGNLKQGDLAVVDLKRYVYYQCLPKIRRRLLASLPENKEQKMHNVITEQLTGSVIGEEFHRTEHFLDANGTLREDPDIPDSLLSADEAWLREGILELYPDIDPPSLASRGNKPITGQLTSYLKLDKTSIKAVFYYLREIIHSVITIVDSIHQLREQVTLENQHPKAGKDRKAELIDLLDALIANMDLLQANVYQSPSVWHLLGNAAVEKAFKSSQIRAPGAGPPGTPEILVDEEDDDDEEWIFRLKGVRGIIRHWLKSVCQWQLALSDITTGRFHRSLISRPLSIKLIRTITSPTPAEQASLTETMQALLGSDATAQELTDRRKALLEHAREKLGYYVKDVDAFLALGDVEQDTMWQGAFKGKAHCESTLAWCMGEAASAPGQPYYYESGLLERSQNSSNGVPHLPSRCSKYIGTSKQCCYTCDVFLGKLDPNLRYGGCHDKVYPWALPSNQVPITVQQDVLESLQTRLQEVVRRITDLTRLTGSEPESPIQGAIIMVKRRRVRARTAAD